jgi:hypothetical protein
MEKQAESKNKPQAFKNTTNESLYLSLVFQTLSGDSWHLRQAQLCLHDDGTTMLPAMHWRSGEHFTL